jgi:hypothetical protein
MSLTLEISGRFTGKRHAFLYMQPAALCANTYIHIFEMVYMCDMYVHGISV